MTFLQRSHICQACKKPKGLRGDKPDKPYVTHGMPLSRRERQIAELNAQALTNKEIGERLHIHEGTVKTFMCPIFIKAGVHNRTALAVWWLKNSDIPSQSA